MSKTWLAGILALTSTMSVYAQTATEVVLHSFGSPQHGQTPLGNLIRDAAGALYGTTTYGGTAGRGVVYAINPFGRQTVLYNFTGPDGANPWGGVTRDAAGNLYGTTQYGGAADAGVIFKLDSAGHETVLYNFTNGADGGYPWAGVTLDPAGNIYGTNTSGATAVGVIYKLDTTGHLTVFHNFSGGYGGYDCLSNLILDPAGDLFGTTNTSVFKVDTAGHFKAIYTFPNAQSGSNPQGGLVRDAAGNFYGTTTYGGSANAGVVFKLDPTGHETVLYNFTNGADGGQPFAGVTLDPAGDLYGTTTTGGAGFGVVYKLDASGHQTVLYTFPAIPEADGTLYGNFYSPGVVRDPAGNLYRANVVGGTGGRGALFKIAADGQASVLYAFPGNTDGSIAYAGVTLAHDPAGSLYGTTNEGGLSNAGTVYKVDAAGHETVLYAFTGGADGSNPCSGVVLDAAGNLYGTTYSGGAATGNAGWGVVYKLDTAGHQTVLHTFTGGADGGNPFAGLTIDSAGNLYGTTYDGGTHGVGVVFKVDTAGNETVVYTFTGASDSGNPWATPLLDSAGNLFGTAAGGSGGSGVVDKIDSSGHETTLYAFTGGPEGRFPIAGVTADAEGNLYGTTVIGDPNTWGAVYKLDKNRRLTVLHTFTGGADGGQPEAAPLIDAAGNLYGTTSGGGLPQSSYGAGVVYQIDPAGTFSVVHNFTISGDGGYPYGGLIRDAAGNLYGATLTGGPKGNGAVFKLTLP